MPSNLLLLGAQAKQVQQLLRPIVLNPDEIRADLKLTQDVDVTVNRYYDGEFLKGTERDPSLAIAVWGQEEDGGVWKGRRRRGNYASGVRLDPSSSPELVRPPTKEKSNKGVVNGKNRPPADDCIYLSDSSSPDNDDARNVRASLSKMSAKAVLAEHSGNVFSSPLPPSPPVPKGKGKAKAVIPSPKDKGKARAPLDSESLSRPFARTFEEYASKSSNPRKRIFNSISPSSPQLPNPIPYNPPVDSDKEEEQLEILAPLPKKRKYKIVVLDLTGDTSDDEAATSKPVVPAPKPIPKPSRTQSDTASRPSKPKPPPRSQTDLAKKSLGGLSEDDDNFFDIDAFKSSELDPLPREEHSISKPLTVVSDESNFFDDSFLDIDDLPAVATTAPTPKLDKGLSAGTLRLLAELSGSDDIEDRFMSKKKQITTKAKTTISKRKTSLPVLSESERATPAGSATTSPKRRRTTDPEKEAEKDRKREEAAAKRAKKDAERAEKDAAKEQRRLAKEATAAEKQKELEFASVNKVVRNKQVSAPEMIVDMSLGIMSTPQTGELAQGFLTTLGCEVNPNWRPAMGIEADWKVIKWRRKTKAKYDPEQRIFMPLPEEIVEDEKHVMVYLTAKEFVDLAFPDEGCMDLNEHVRKMRRLVPIIGDKAKLLYLIEGLTAYVRKCINAANKALRDEVARQQSGDPDPAPNRRKRKTEEKAVNEDLVEDALLQLQMVHNCLIHHTAAPIESAEWISVFTGDISTIPYKKARTVLDTAFCTEVGQVKTGADKKDTYIKVLQEVHRITLPIAKGIEREYPDILSLVKAFRAEGKECLGDIPIYTGRTGGSRNIGLAMSRRIAGTFLGADPLAMAET